MIEAPAEGCFDLMRDIRIHTQTTAQTHERVIGGVTAGRLELGQVVTFKGRHFGLTQRLTVKVIEFDRPHRFVDEMASGSFSSFVHVHEFKPTEHGTLMIDTVSWRSPLGIIGRIVDTLLLKRHLTSRIGNRNAALKAIAEQQASAPQG